jgi:Anti-sigma factor NepR
MSKSPPASVRPLPAQTRNPNSERDIGGALRAAYDSAVNEAIPPEMLELLSKLR